MITGIVLYKLRSVQFLLENNFLEAIPDFDKAIELNPNDLNCVFIHASAKRKLGDNEGADKDERKAEKIKNT